MFIATTTVLFWLAQLTADPTPADPPPTRPIEQQVAELVEQLQGGDDAASSQAEERLIELGSDALVGLPKVTAETPERTRIQLRRIRKALASAPAERSLEPIKYSIVGEMTAEEAFRSLQKQAGLPVDILENYESEMSQTKLRFDVKEKPFWQAVEVLMAKAKLMPTPYSGDSRLFALVPDGREAGPQVGHVDSSGPFRFEVSRFEAVRDFQDPSNQILRLVVMMYWEPRVVPVTMSQVVDQIKIKTGDHELRLLSEQVPSELAVIESLASVELEFPFDLPSRSVPEIEQLSGKVNALVPGITQKFTFQNLGTGRLEQERGEVQVIIQRAKTIQGLQDVRLLVKLGEVDEAMRTNLSWAYDNIAYLADAKGKRFDDVLTEISQEDEGEIAILYKYDAPGDISDYTFHYESPTGFTTVSASYTLKNIELP
jgi:hypothetical protein